MNYDKIISYLVDTIFNFGYFGIFILMFLESSFFPFPSEVVMVPAGYLAYEGKMNLYLIIISGVLGSLFGALFNYYLAKLFGRKILIKIINKKYLIKLDNYFNKHGEISTFNGRLIPGIRQYISFPAGLSNMNIFKFSLYTILGAGIWVIILTLLGYFIGYNKNLIKIYLGKITIILLIVVGLISFIYFLKNKDRK